ncbi:cytochrome c oxidase subunit 3 [Acidisoma cladoniae]|jgi:cytochrome c oxidase subunit 3|uniref:cytochrome c oxidase subunit 3 n=1 Tax=Acidisoma cladoniae TaxID=3040935 RepID=UPI00254CFEBA|nr:cytochrome c oxidase subunit 3 [Acidisoma sp. PAMC 29798]
MSTDMSNAATVTESGLKNPYYFVKPSHYPIIGSFSAMFVLMGIIFAAHFGNYIVLALGILSLLTTMFFWFRTVVRESLIPGAHSILDLISVRYGMTLFITSEVMFFVAFFWAFFNFAVFPENVSGATHRVWPPEGIHTFDPFSLPFLNTLILLLSGTTITWAHHALIENDRKSLMTGLGATILLGLSFTCCQAVEYSHAPFKFSGGGIFPSVFFLATGFHGFHVIVGTIFLIVCYVRSRDGQFTPKRHFGFEAAAWYWHFVDVVWLFLYVCIYLWGASKITVA